MKLHELLAAFPLAFIVISGAILLICAGVFGFAFYVAINWAIDELQMRKRRPMATPMDRDEIMLRRLKRSVHTRISTIKQANP
jgi:hypothetical protein